MLLHDIADPPMELAKLCLYSGYETVNQSINRKILSNLLLGSKCLFWYVYTSLYRLS